MDMKPPLVPTLRLLPLLLAGCAGGGGGIAPGPMPFEVLSDPSHPEFDHPSPERYEVLFETSQGDFVVEVHEAWAPNGARRFYNLVRAGYYDGVRFFRVIPGFVAQFGLHGDPRVTAAWRPHMIPDDPVAHPNERGTLTFATAGPGTRTVQLFINLVDNVHLDASGFAPIGRVTEGLEVVDRLYGGYGEGAPRGQGPDQGRIQLEGEDYLFRDFPQLSRIHRARIVNN